MAAKTNTQKPEAVNRLAPATVNKIGQMFRDGELNGGTFLADVAKLARELPKITTAADCGKSAEAIAAAAGRPDDKPMRSRIAIILEYRHDVPHIVAKLKDARTCTREHVLSTLRFMRKHGKSADQACALVIKGKRVGAAKAADPLKAAVRALTALRDAKRGKVRDAAIDCLALLEKVA